MALRERPHRRPGREPWRRSSERPKASAGGKRPWQLGRPGGGGRFAGVRHTHGSEMDRTAEETGLDDRKQAALPPEPCRAWTAGAGAGGPWSVWDGGGRRPGTFRRRTRRLPGRNRHRIDHASTARTEEPEAMPCRGHGLPCPGCTNPNRFRLARAEGHGLGLESAQRGAWERGDSAEVGEKAVRQYSVRCLL